MVFSLLYALLEPEDSDHFLSLTVTAMSSLSLMGSLHALDLDAVVSNSCEVQYTNLWRLFIDPKIKVGSLRPVENHGFVGASGNSTSIHRDDDDDDDRITIRNVDTVLATEKKQL
ncbi:hypothetical protein ARMGADRAFT_1075933 [Armillaria gallica]|uniref:Uncharacterized protein n=1 Tax=Armillaria gallica TaxID=47427 RepID=A0A2H3E182_ARMGA|nr:hypothetical protein ARMGADRAFT_1075933 [Armillaria gallica]